MRFADAHLHFSEPNVGEKYPDIGDAEVLFSCAAQYSDWKVQTAMTDDRIVRFYGIHPWYHDQWSVRTKDELITILENDPSAQVGEIGMDNKRPGIELQSAVFTSQVMIANDFGRCINVHNQGCDGDIVRIIKKHGKDCRSVILHSFKGPSIKPYSGLNCYFSMNARMLGKAPEKVREMLLSIPEDRILVETDAPYVSTKFESMNSFIGLLAQLMDRDPDELSEITMENARRAVQ